MVAAGAADADRQVRLSFFHVGREQEGEEPLQLAEERPGLGLFHHVAPDLRVGPRQGPQRLDPVGVGQEPAVEDEVDVERQAVLEAEGDDAGLERVLGRAGGEQVPQPVPQLVDVEVRRVDDDVGLGPQGLEQRPLLGDGQRHPLPHRQRVLAPAGLVAPDEDVVGCFQEQDAGPGAGLPELLQGDMEVLQGAGADVGPEGVAGRGPARGPGQLGHLGDEQRR